MSQQATTASVPGLDIPGDWKVQQTSGPRPFVTRAVLARPDGSIVEWTSRRHRKRLGLRLTDRDTTTQAPWLPPSRSSLALGVLFGIGSLLFAVGPLPAFEAAVSTTAVAWTFFAGSVFFTSAGYLQYREAITAPTGPDDDAPVPQGMQRILALAPHRIDWWASTIQLVGTIFFNISTFAATRTTLGIARERHWIWAPDLLGSICFLVASWLAFAEAGAGGHGLRHRSLGWWISAINLLGSIAFGASAIGARYLRTTGEIANLSLANLGTFAGAVCFLIGAALLPVESARRNATA